MMNLRKASKCFIDSFTCVTDAKIVVLIKTSVSSPQGFKLSAVTEEDFEHEHKFIILFLFPWIMKISEMNYKNNKTVNQLYKKKYPVHLSFTPEFLR